MGGGLPRLHLKREISSPPQKSIMGLKNIYRSIIRKLTTVMTYFEDKRNQSHKPKRWEKCRKKNTKMNQSTVVNKISVHIVIYLQNV